MLSPVIAEESSVVKPSVIIPSRGILLCGFTIISVPVRTSSAATVVSFPFLITTAVSGLIFESLAIFFLERATALASSISPISKRIVTIAASGYSPIQKAAITAMVKSVVSSIFNFTIVFTPSRKISCHAANALNA